MLIDLLSEYNYARYNIKIANLINLESAIYISELINIFDKATIKNKVEEGFFVVNRSYIKSRTTFENSKQLEIDEALIKLNIIEKNSKNSLHLNLDVLSSMMSIEDDASIKNIKKILKENSKSSIPKLTKTESIINNLKNFVNVENDELRIAYYDWIAGVYANPKGFLSGKAVQIAQQKVDAFANHDLDKAIQLLNIAALNGYRDIDWAIEKYINTPIKTTSISKSPISVSKEEF